MERQVGTPEGEGAAVGRLAALLTEAAGAAVVLTGAGVSVPSGIPDFRTPETGLWANVDPTEVAGDDPAVGRLDQQDLDSEPLL